jgi:hypothetical protein
MTKTMDRRRFLIAGAAGLTAGGALASAGLADASQPPTADLTTLGGPPMISGVISSLGAGSIVVRTTVGDVTVATSASTQNAFLEVVGRGELQVLDEVAVLGRWDADRFIATEITPLFRAAGVNFVPDARGEGRIGGVLYRLSPIRARLERWRGIRQRPDSVVYAQVASGDRVVVDGPNV